MMFLQLQVQTMSEVNIAKGEQESFQNFMYRFQLAEKLPLDKKGIIFVGNTRAGKSTLALAMSGAAMKVVYLDGAVTYLNPSDEKFKDVVRNTQQSVTETPNFYKSRMDYNKWAIVDMPGHADSSRFRELINFHYIRTMASNLKEVRFLIVVTLQYRNGGFLLNDKEIRMLDSFRMMFPNCSNCVNIIINRIDDLKANQKAACACFRDTIAKSKNNELKKYYGGITDKRIHVIERPTYRLGDHGEERHEAPYDAINRKMYDICNDEEAQFLELKEHDYYTLNIFKEGDHAKNQLFRDKLIHFSKMINEGVEQASSVFKQTLLVILQSIVKKGSCGACRDQLLDMYNSFLCKYSIETPFEKQLQPIVFQQKMQLEYSKILQLLHFITQERFTYKRVQKKDRKDLKQREQYSRTVADNYLSKLLQVIELSFGKGELYRKIMDFYLYLIRRTTESYFIANIMISKQSQQGQDQNGVGIVYLSFQQFRNIPESFFDSFYILVQSMINIDVGQLFSKFARNQFEGIKQEMINNFTIIQNLGALDIKDKEKFRNVILPQINKKKDEISFFVMVSHEPQNSKETNTLIENLLKSYHESEFYNRIKILHKLAKIFEQQKEYYKHALVLYLSLSLNQEAMRMLTLLQGTIEKEKAGPFLSEVAAAFEDSAAFYYAQRCLELAKKHSIDELDRFIQYEQRVLRLYNPTFTSEKIDSRIQRMQKDKKQGLWDWNQIDNEILFLMEKFRIKHKGGSKSSKSSHILLKNYR